MSESSSSTEVQVRINQKPYLVVEAKKISYEDALKVTKSIHGSSLFYIDTKGKIEDRRAGFLSKGESVEIRDGLDISVMTIIDTMKGGETV